MYIENIQVLPILKKKEIGYLAARKIIKDAEEKFY